MESWGFSYPALKHTSYDYSLSGPSRGGSRRKKKSIRRSLLPLGTTTPPAPPLGEEDSSPLELSVLPRPAVDSVALPAQGFIMDMGVPRVGRRKEQKVLEPQL